MPPVAGFDDVPASVLLTVMCRLGQCKGTLASFVCREWAAAVAQARKLCLFDVVWPDARLRRRFEGCCSRRFVMNHDGRVMASLVPYHTSVSNFYQGRITLLNTQTGACLGTIDHTKLVTSVAFSTADMLASSGYQTRDIKVWNAGALLTQPQPRPTPWESQRPSPWYPSSFYQDLCLRHTLKGHSKRVDCVAFSQDGAIIASGSWDRTVKLWSTATGACLQTLEGHEAYVPVVAFSPSGATVASGSGDETVKIWSTETGECLNTLIESHKCPRVLAFSRDNHIVTSGQSDGVIKLWSTETGACRLLRARMRNDVILNPAVVVNGAVVVSRVFESFQFDCVKIWCIETGACLHTLKGHLDRIRSVAISPDGGTIASGSRDGTIKLWKVQTGACLKTLTVDTTNELVRFSADDSMAFGTAFGAELWVA